MSTTTTAPSAPPRSTPPPGPSSGARRPAAAGHLAAYLPGAVLTVLATLMLGFVAHVAVVSGLQQARTQQVAYADFRIALAEGTAPVSQIDSDGRLVAVGTAVAVIEIPSIGVREVVFEGTSGQVLQDGPGHRRDTVFPGQSGSSVLMGRRDAYGGPFHDLEQLDTGDLMTVTTGQGEHVYEVLDVRRPGDLAPLPPDDPDTGRMVLTTGLAENPFVPTDSLRVDTELVSDPAPTPAPAIEAGSVPPAELGMGTDSSHLFTLVLWLQLLVVAAGATVWLRSRWGRWQTWTVAMPVLAVVGIAVADQATLLLPNLL